MLVATRHYHDFDPKMGESDELQDRLLRMGERSFVLMVAGEKPGDPEIAKALLHITPVVRHDPVYAASAAGCL